MKDRRIAVAAAMAAVFVVTAGVLLWMGRTPWCACGSPVPWSWVVMSRHASQHLLDPYSFTHMLHGVAFFGLLWFLPAKVGVGWRAVMAATLEGAWEILENTPMVIERYRAETVSLDYVGDSVANSMSDIAACLLGFWIASRLPWRWSVGLFVAVEVVLLLWIKDSLIVNVIMLIHPIEAIKRWQM